MRIYVIARNGGDNVKKRYVRYRLISESSIIEQNEDNQQKQDKPKTATQGTSEETALQLLGKAVKVLAKAGVDATRLVYTTLKQMGGIIIALIKKFIQKLPSISAKVFSFVYSLVKFFWNTFGKGFLNLLNGLAAICATFLGSLSNLLNKILGNAGKGSSGTGATQKGEPQSNNYAPNFMLSDRAIKILNEAASNPRAASKTLDNIIEKAKPGYENLCRRCIKGNVAKTNPELACTIGASTTLVCGNPSPSDQFTNLQNRTNAKTNQ